MGGRSRWMLLAAAPAVLLLVATLTWVFWYREATSGFATAPARPYLPGRPIGTQVIPVVAVDGNGHPLNGHRLVSAAPDPGNVTTVFGCSASRAAIADNIYSCSPSAAGADVC